MMNGYGVCPICSEQALLAEGGQLDDPASFVRRLNGLLAMLPG
jgi:molecular chaperone HtpG